MPSSAKKKKSAAAKKKKGNKPPSSSTLNSSATTSSRENDVTSPVSEDRQKNEELGLIEEEKRDPSPVRSIVDEKVVKEDDGGGVTADRELNSEQESESQNGSVDHLDSVTSSYNRSSSSSSGSSRSYSSYDDGESQVVEKNSLASESNEYNDKGGSLITEGTDVSDYVTTDETHYNSIKESEPIELIEPVPEKGIPLTETDQIEKDDNLSDSALNEEARYNSVTEPEPIVDSIKLDEPVLEKVIPLTETDPLGTTLISDVTELSPNEKDDNLSDNAPNEEARYNSVTKTEPSVDSIKLDEPVLEKVIPLTETLVNPNWAELGADEKEEQLLPSLDETESTRASGTVIDIESEKNEDKGIPLSYENYGGSSSANAPFTGTGNGEEHGNVYEILDSSENQPLIAATPRPVQKTSWKSCCGLFDLLTKTNDRKFQ